MVRERVKTPCVAGGEAAAPLGLSLYSTSGKLELPLPAPLPPAAYRWPVAAIVTIAHVLNGVADGTFTLPRNPAINLTGSNLLVIGQDGVNTTRDWNGYIDEFRFSLLAHYTGPYADPGVPFSLAPDLPPSTLRIELESERSGLVSWQRHNHTVNLS